MHKQKQAGFTIVELLIVVVVIAILAAITIVSYAGIRDRAMDTRRATDLNSLRNAVMIWSGEKNLTIDVSGTGFGGNGNGWVTNSSYPKSLENLLIEQGYLSSPIRDPVTPTGVGSYMVYKCSAPASSGQDRTFGLFARMANPDQPGNDKAEWDALGCVSGGANSTYGMNYIKMFVL